MAENTGIQCLVHSQALYPYLRQVAQSMAVEHLVDRVGKVLVPKGPVGMTLAVWKAGQGVPLVASANQPDFVDLVSL